MQRFVFDNPELSGSDFAACSMGENSFVSVANTSKKLLGKVRITCGRNCKIVIRGISVLNSGISIFMNNDAIFDMGPGQMFHGYFNMMMHEPSEIKIGSDCLWGSGDVMTSDCHSIVDCITRERINPAKDICISSRVWLGAGIKIFKGANIASDTVIASGAIVASGDYPANSILAGSPAKVVKSGIAWDVELL